jgi:hypothetical protein
MLVDAMTTLVQERVRIFMSRKAAAGLAAILALGGCATVPPGPNVPVMPGNGKSFEAFQADQGACMQYANDLTSDARSQATTNAIGTAVVTTLLGAGLGAAAGGGTGAAIGAGAGAVAGTALGVNSANWSQYPIQQRYDIAYAQCMAAKGNKVPAYGAPVVSARPAYAVPVTPVAPPPQGPGAVVTPAQ